MSETGDVLIDVWGNDVDDAAIPTSGSDANSKALTLATTQYSPPSWVIGNTYDIDVTTIVQEIVNRGGWDSGNNLQIIHWYNSGLFRRSYKTYATGSGIPKLVINYGGGVEFSIDSTWNISTILNMQGTVMRGNIGDTYATITVPISISGTIQNSPLTYLSGTLAIPITISGTIDAPQFYASYAYLEVPELSLYGAGSVTTTFGTAYLTPKGLTLSGVGYGTVAGDAASDVPIITLSASGSLRVIGAASLTFPRLKVSASAWHRVTGTLDKPLPALDLSTVLQRGIVGTLDQDIPPLTLSLSASGRASIAGTAEISLPLLSLLTTTLPLSATYLNMVMNIKNRALTLYNNYNFNSLCHYNGKNFGATKTKIVDLDTGSTDDGTIIDWNFRTGYLDLEQDKKKKIRQAWLSYKSNGDIILTIVQPDGEEYEYTLDGIYDDETGVRCKFGRGIRSKYVAIDIKNVDGSTIDLDVLRLALDKYDGKR
jgi:hypothetical protein